jgi:hypothetical protein
MNASSRNNESTKHLTSVESEFTVDCMLRLADIEKSLRQQKNTDVKQLQSNLAEQNKLRPYVQRYRDLQNDAKTREERLARTMALIGESEFKDSEKLSGNEASNSILIQVPTELPLWMAIYAIVEQVPEIQVVDLQAALEHFRRKASRQAIESALASHKETFEIKMRGRNKFVSLKR